MPSPVSPGCYVCLRTPGIFGRLVRIATRSPVNHVVIIGPDGTVIEATPRGARVTTLARYKGTFALANTAESLTQAQRDAVVKAAQGYAGDEYGWGAIAVISLRLLGLRWGWLRRIAEDKGALTCSELVCKAGLAAGLTSWQCGEADAAYVTPADLARRPGLQRVPWATAR